MKKRNIYWANKDKYKRQKENETYYLNRTRNQTFYHSKEWNQVRLFVLSSNVICQACTNEIASEVHHTININTNEGWNKRLHTDLLESRCKPCHSNDTVREQYERKHNVKVQSIEDRMDDLNDFN